MIDLEPKPDFVRIEVSGKLTGDDYDRLIPELERIAAERGALRLYMELRDFAGWEPEALWEDIKFDATHQDEMDRVAVVGDSSWEEWGTRLSDPFFKADLRFFTYDEADEARSWVRET